MTKPTPQNPGLLNWVLIITLSVIWGAAFLAVKVALEAYPPLTVAALRTGIAALVLMAISSAMGQGPRTVGGRRGWGAAAAIGLSAVALPFVLLSWGQQFVPSAFAGVSMGAGPLMVLLLVAIFSPDEGIGPRRVVGMGLGFVGLVVLLGPQALASNDTAAMVQFLGQCACILAAAGYAVGSILTRRAPVMPPLALATATTTIAAALLVPLALYVDGLPHSTPLRPSFAVLFAALGPTALAAVIRVRVITTAGSLFMSITSYLVPVWSVIFGVLLLSEALPPRLFYALGLILVGIGISQSRAIQTALRR